MTILMQNTYKWGLLACLAILPMAGTIALRNLMLVMLLLMLLIWLVRCGWRDAGGRDALGLAPLPLWPWVVFLLLFPLWAAQPDVALSNLKGQWAESLIAWVLGWGAVIMLGRRGPSLWELAGASAFLVGLHLLLTLLAWSGIFGPLASNFLTWTEMWSAMTNTLVSGGGVSWRWQGFPWRFVGFDPMHGNLGYTASQAITLLAVIGLMAWRARRFNHAAGAILIIGACLSSIVIASSRGAVLFSLLVLAVAGVVYWLRLRKNSAVEAKFAEASRFALLAMVVMGVAVGAVLFQIVSKDARWRTMADKTKAGFLIEEPARFLCEGLSPNEKDRLLARLGITDPARAEEIIAGLGSDGGRIVLMRVGLDMLHLQPLGLDGSRQSFKKMMAERCGHAPAFDFAHTHQAWIDTALALGWPGVLLLAWLLGWLLVAGWRALAREPQSAWAFALVLLSAFWILRGFADAVYREHYLQMQAMLLGYVYGRMKLAAQEAPVPAGHGPR